MSKQSLFSLPGPHAIYKTKRILSEIEICLVNFLRHSKKKKFEMSNDHFMNDKQILTNLISSLRR